MNGRTPAYGPTGILLVVGFIATVIASALAFTLVLAGPPMFGPEPTFLGLPNHVVVAAVGLGPVLVGFAWMLRIFLGARDEPPA